MERANTRETSALIKRYIKEKYNVCAKVRTSKYSGGDSLHIEYTAGPDERIIKPLFNNLQEGDFDGMIDLYEYRDKSGLSLYGKELETRKYVFVRQEIPAPLYFALAKCYSDANNFTGIPKLETPEQLYKNDPAFGKWAGGCWNWQNFFHRAFKDRNFCTDETDKIKIISCEDDPDKNRAVIFTYEYEGKRYKTNKFELPGKPAKAAKPDPEKEKTMTGEEYFVVNLTSRPWKIIEKYPDFEAYRKDIIPAREGERETFWVPLILFNLRKFEAENLFEFFPDLKLSEIHHILTKENKGE